ncbi:MAG TPA: DUF3179 domain-containing (seleno)protein [Isosphaeraceae bacterium]|jgi:hypothetical protein|nr:DUF3179 domain-containing (seleno)protein [Isosphaeraceae bacterium]
MAQADQAMSMPAPEQAKASPILSRWVALGLLALLVTFILARSRTLWGEWQALSTELTHARQTTVIGYIEINRNPSHAARPRNWIHDEGDFTLLWTGWKPKEGEHGWFKVARGDLDRGRMSLPLGRDVIQAIDTPIVEVGGGSRWERIPYDSTVAGLVIHGVPCVYPLTVLKSVEVVNDEIQQHPLLVTFAPFAPRDRSIHVYNPILNDRRVTMGLSGYLHDKKPLLYDRDSESLWVEQDDQLEAIAGCMKGAHLELIGEPSLVNWGDWRSQHPESRLLVGADRARTRSIE